jgi:hypothetical protein
MDHTNELERWRLEMELDRIQTQLDEALLVLARIDELAHLLRNVNAADDEQWRNVGRALQRLLETYASWHRTNYPDGRP